MPVELTVSNLHPSRSLDAGWLENLARAALPACLAARGPGDAPLADLDEIEINLVDDPTIDRVHRDFMGIEGATDVITFHHGEIVLSLDTADRQAAEHGSTFEREVLLYAIHGLLHLNGHTDTDAESRAVMAKEQERIAGEVGGIQSS